MDSGDLYNDYEPMIEVARILENNKELKYAKDVFAFIDYPNKYDEVIKQLIEETFLHYYYEAHEEVAKD